MDSPLQAQQSYLKQSKAKRVGVMDGCTGQLRAKSGKVRSDVIALLGSAQQGGAGQGKASWCNGRLSGSIKS